MIKVGLKYKVINDFSPARLKGKTEIGKIITIVNSFTEEGIEYHSTNDSPFMFTSNELEFHLPTKLEKALK